MSKSWYNCPPPQDSPGDSLLVLLQFLLKQRFIISGLKHCRWSFSDFHPGPRFLSDSSTICIKKDVVIGSRQPCFGSRITIQDSRHQAGQSHPRTLFIVLLSFPSSSPHFLHAGTGKARKSVVVLFVFSVSSLKSLKKKFFQKSAI